MYQPPPYFAFINPVSFKVTDSSLSKTSLMSSSKEECVHFYPPTAHLVSESPQFSGNIRQEVLVRLQDRAAVDLLLKDVLRWR